jgi:ABC-type Fe3+/spermidine/putrescine transport system ATPase subunit
MVSVFESAPPCLEIAGIWHYYGDKAALKDIWLDARQSEVLALLGPSGSGKSTLLAAVAGMIEPSGGAIRLRGRNLIGLAPEDRGLGMVFQDYALWPHMTVMQNVAFPLRARRLPASEVTIRAQNAVARVGLEGFEARRPHQLSGGQQQRVALARAVTAEPQLLLLDEPLSALDPATRAAVRGELAALLRKLGLTSIIVTHEREEAFELADRVAVLVDGQIQQHASPREVYERPANLAVARFMGVNLLALVIAGDGRAALRNNPICSIDIPPGAAKGAAEIAIVAERTRVVDPRSVRGNVIEAEVLRCQYRGGEYRLQVRLGSAESGQIIEARSQEQPRGEQVFVHLPIESLHLIGSTARNVQTAAARPLVGRLPEKFQEEIA